MKLFHGKSFALIQSVEISFFVYALFVRFDRYFDNLDSTDFRIIY